MGYSMHEVQALLEMLATVAALSMFTKDVVRMLASRLTGGRDAHGKTIVDAQGAKNGRRFARGGGMGEEVRGKPRLACSLFLSISIRSATLRLRIGTAASDAGCGA